MSARPDPRIVNTGAACRVDLHELCEHGWCDCSCHPAPVALTRPITSIVARYSTEVLESRSALLEGACRFALEVGAGVAAIDDPDRSTVVAYVTTRIPAFEVRVFPSLESFTDWLNS